GCMVVASDLSTLGRVLNGTKVELADRHVASVQKRVTNIRDELGKNVTTKDVREGIVQGIENSYRVRLEEGTLTKSELSTSKELYDTKYSKSTWNLEK